MSQRLRVRFGRAEHGWLPVELDAGDQHLAFVASYVYDSLSQLVQALITLLAAEGLTIAKWNTEPAEYEFRFSPSEDAARLEVVEFADTRRVQAQGTTVFAIDASRREVVLPFWRALSALQTDAGFEQGWGTPFPSRDMRLLSKQLEVG